MPYDVIERDGQYCLQKKDTGKMVPGSCHADKAMTMKMMRAMMANENMTTHAYLFDKFLTTRIGEPYRLFPFGRVVKNGVVHNVTPENAKNFKLPHYKPAIKMGSHEDVTPACGHIVGLEVRADGLYAIPEWNDAGAKILNEGSYRYQSPEVIWEDGALEDPTTGALIRGPLIVGDALLHDPHLGEAAALYQVEPITKENPMTFDPNAPVSVPGSFLTQLLSAFGGGKPAPIAPEPVVKIVPPEDYEATKQERDALRARELKAQEESKRAELKAQIVRELQSKDKDGKKNVYGSVYIALDAAEEAASMLATMTPEQRDWVSKNFRAFIAQIDEGKLLGEKGKQGDGGATSDDPKAQFNAEVLLTSAKEKIDYNRAFEVVKALKPDLFVAAFAKKAKE